MTKFERRLPKGSLDYLRGMPGWWRDVLDHRYRDNYDVERPLLIALRAGYLNVYAEGQSILKVGFDARGGEAPRLRAKINRKYVFGPQSKDDYLVFDGSRTTDPSDPQTTEAYAGPETITRWVEAARHYSGDEKGGVARIAENHPNVIDVEMALPANEPSADERKVAKRMDIVALESVSCAEGPPIRLAFYEAKLFGNPELRADDLKPKVARQLQAYRDYVSEAGRKQEVIEAYRCSCVVLNEIASMRGVTPGEHVKAVAGGETFDLDPMPRLVIFDYDAAKVGETSSWNRHEQAFRDQGISLVMSPSPGVINLPA